MSVYTTISRDELSELLGHYGVGELIQFEGILAGIENTNYFVTTTRGEYVLTIFEQIVWDELPFFLDYMAFLAEHRVPSAHPIADINGDYLREFKQKPAALVERLQGGGVEKPNLTQCRALGEALGHMHAIVGLFEGYRENPRDITWCQQASGQLDHVIGEEAAALLHSELEFQRRKDRQQLPQGVIHADLFRDNALFVGEQLTGIIDFYYACNDALLYDVAVTVNDWCVNPDGSIDQARYQALLNAYQQQRPLVSVEQALWPTMLRAAALRFWLSRLVDKHFPRSGEITHIKEPLVFESILKWHRDYPLALP